MITPDTTYRSQAAELMDDFSLEGEMLRDALDKIGKINRLLGGNRLTLRGVQQLLRQQKERREVVVLDAGCGNGDMLRALSDYAKRNDLNLRLVGVDANAFTIDYARQLSAAFENIAFIKADIFGEIVEKSKPDIILCTLTLHHFKDEEIIHLMKKLVKSASIGVVINDLHRSAMSYRLFQLICLLFGLNKMSRDDGLISILRGFKKEDIESYSKLLGLKKYSVRWRWAFRYQWIISNL